MKRCAIGPTSQITRGSTLMSALLIHALIQKVGIEEAQTRKGACLAARPKLWLDLSSSVKLVS